MQLEKVLVVAALVVICSGQPARVSSRVYFTERAAASAPQTEPLGRSRVRQLRDGASSPAVAASLTQIGALPAASSAVVAARSNAWSTVVAARSSATHASALIFGVAAGRAPHRPTLARRRNPSVDTAKTQASARASDGVVTVNVAPQRRAQGRPSSAAEESVVDDTPPRPSIIHFEERPTRRRRFPLPQCGGRAFQAYHNVSGDCQELWTADSCQAGYWFVVDYNSGEAGCRPKPCQDHHVLVEARCRPVNASALCADGMRVVIDEYGHGVCDCVSGFVFWPRHARCYPAYRRGPCAAGRHLVVTDSHPTVQCEPSSCPDGQALWVDGAAEEGAPMTATAGRAATEPAGASCYPLNTTAGSPCPGGKLTVDAYTLQLKCQVLKLFAIFDPPVVRCATGSMRDFNGDCRQELFQKFRTTFLRSGEPAGTSVCSDGFVLTTRGSCVHAMLAAAARPGPTGDSRPAAARPGPTGDSRPAAARPGSTGDSRPAPATVRPPPPPPPLRLLFSSAAAQSRRSH